ncbi:MAG TPA: hypothetical protein VFG14_20880 [Chthoniobacteraceae bacterium]|nr:hypothetical protein [Chthoniobacteraceae bacterium]
MQGGYWLQPERDGSLRFDCGISFPVAVHWQPALGYRAKYKSDAIGLIYAPLILADRQWFHPTKYVHKTDDWEWLTHEMTISDVHPQWREKWKKSKASE